MTVTGFALADRGTLLTLDSARQIKAPPTRRAAETADARTIGTVLEPKVRPACGGDGTSFAVSLSGPSSGGA
jgi:hypothetical protein